MMERRQLRWFRGTNSKQKKPNEWHTAMQICYKRRCVIRYQLSSRGPSILPWDFSGTGYFWCDISVASWLSLSVLEPSSTKLGNVSSSHSVERAPQKYISLKTGAWPSSLPFFSPLTPLLFHAESVLIILIWDHLSSRFSSQGYLPIS